MLSVLPLFRTLTNSALRDQKANNMGQGHFKLLDIKILDDILLLPH